ncbi:MAG: mandelate racemase/muconate lactonizing enzyme family protein [Spirochaetales bacterium]|nr:mandelate racemase/muconate lactonizing enzyme family protein [Spirochaetales bacterium]
MKITDVKTVVVKNIPPYRGGKEWLWIRLITDEGIVGIGERVTGPGAKNLRSQIKLIEEFSQEHVIGSSPFDVEKLWQRIFSIGHDYRHPSLDSTPALSAIEMACWDVIGKAVNQPIYNLLGGRHHEKLKAYAYMPSGFREDPEKAGEIAVTLLEQGNKACKLDPFMPEYPIPRDIPLEEINKAVRIFKSIRNAVGDKLEVGIGTHGQLTTYSAIRVAHALEEFQPFWFEEPVAPENVDEMARVAAHTSIPIAAGERKVTKYEFAELLKKQAAQILQMDVGQCGGILESKKIAGMAEAHYAMIAPHMACGPISAAAAVQLDTCSPNFLAQEYNGGQLHQELFKNPIIFSNGYIIPPEGPGLGLEIDEKVLKKYTD